MKGVDLLILKDQLGLKSNAELVRTFDISEVSFYTHLKSGKDLKRTLALASSALVAGLDPYEIPKDYDLSRIAERDAMTLHWLTTQYVGMGPRFGDGRLVFDLLPERVR